MKNFLLCLLVLVSASCAPDAWGDVFNIGVEDDVHIRRLTSNGSLFVHTNDTGSTVGTQNGLRVGSVSAVPGYRAVAILPFAMPVLPAGHTVIGANLTFSAREYGTNGGSVRTDLYGLDRRAGAAVLTTDYYFSGSDHINNTHDTNPATTLIQDAILATGAPNANSAYLSFETDTNADTALVGYLNNQYTSGAGPGDFAFFRFNNDRNLFTGFQLGSSTAGTEAQLTITTSAVPEPSAFLFGTLVCTFLGLRSARRERRCAAR